MFPSAAAVALSLGIPPEAIAAGLPGTTLPGMRMKTVSLDGVTYINDAYNANPRSMAAALRLLASDAPRRLVLLLGGMRELGSVSAEEHRRILELARELLPDAAIVTVGAEFSSAAAEFGVGFFPDAKSAAAEVAELALPGVTVFAKGSRFHALELALPPEAR